MVVGSWYSRVWSSWNVSLCDGLVMKHQFLRQGPAVRKDMQNFCFNLVYSSNFWSDQARSLVGFWSPFQWLAKAGVGTVPGEGGGHLIPSSSYMSAFFTPVESYYLVIGELSLEARNKKRVWEYSTGYIPMEHSLFWSFELILEANGRRWYHHWFATFHLGSDVQLVAWMSSWEFLVSSFRGLSGVSGDCLLENRLLDVVVDVCFWNGFIILMLG